MTTINGATQLREEELEGVSAEERIRWAAEQFGDELIMTTSFGTHSAVMLHLVTSVLPDIPVVFIDTGYLFPETYRFAEDLRERLDLNLKKYHSLRSAAEQEALFGKLWENGEEGLKQYNLMNKVEPMNRAVKELGAKAWLAGLRRSQGASRSERQIVESQNQLTKIYPILDWDNRTMHQYLTKHELPYHPLWDEGYVSLGDWHSTSKLMPGMAEEDTRFGGLKRECGLHELSGQADFQI
ncbi:phosphoadenosine phosphosulfate reductase [Pelagicoccus sp. SDUM812003]|uniref:phosphoadenosine phosphosulfate reductase n=1 Tax=Pelagicoccus sp. SDUM812003 TaxID=3041267 RepID=UPI00280E6F77|nr:phosphoadenosine phosphosulfate reductase [Pelagicoccus sp. SDUM812003]MDQ8203945.1 phosphoadenosine phosphosulfate reductase [Pelagicoccus sp. SDUM812003]